MESESQKANASPVGFSARDLILIAFLGAASVLLVGVTVQPLTALSAGILPPTFWAGMSFQFFAILIRMLVGRHLTNTLAGIVVGVNGIFLLPIGVFSLVACSAQGGIQDLMFLACRDRLGRKWWACLLTAGVANACFTFIVMYFFFGAGAASPLVWWVPLTGISGGIFGLLGHLTGRRLLRIMPQWQPVETSQPVQTTQSDTNKP